MFQENRKIFKKFFKLRSPLETARISLTYYATKLLFKVADGIHGYKYTLDNVTTETLKGGNAYILPAITDNSKWELQY